MTDGYNEGICKNAMEQGYADLAHKMGCNLPHTGTDLLPIVFLALALLVLGCIVVFVTLRGKMGK